MFAPKDLPDDYAAWNGRHGAPYGKAPDRLTRRLFGGWREGFNPRIVRAKGPFAWQSNNDTRAFEYPWAHEQITTLGRNLTIADVGGGLAGMQWVLQRDGHQVLNVDPGLEAEGIGFDLDGARHRALTAWLAPGVRQIPAPLQEAGLADGSVDVILSVSTIEHFSEGDLAAFAEATYRALRPGGHLVATIDLFLDLVPFTTQTTNRWGRNMDVADLLTRAKLDLSDEHGLPMYGFEGFEVDAVLRDLPNLLIGHGHPTLTQCVVARKPDH